MIGVRIRATEELATFIETENVKDLVEHFIEINAVNVEPIFNNYKEVVKDMFDKAPAPVKDNAEEFRKQEESYDFESFKNDLLIAFSAQLYAFYKVIRDPEELDFSEEKVQKYYIDSLRKHLAIEASDGCDFFSKTLKSMAASILKDFSLIILENICFGTTPTFKIIGYYEN